MNDKCAANKNAPGQTLKSICPRATYILSLIFFISNFSLRLLSDSEDRADLLVDQKYNK